MGEKDGNGGKEKAGKKRIRGDIKRDGVEKKVDQSEKKSWAKKAGTMTGKE